MCFLHGRHFVPFLAWYFSVVVVVAALLGKTTTAVSLVIAVGCHRRRRTCVKIPPTKTWMGFDWARVMTEGSSLEDGFNEMRGMNM